jgi:HKD family nuclease
VCADVPEVRGGKLKLRVLKSRPLTPIAGRLKELTRASREVWIASAFLSKQAVQVLADGAEKGGAQLRLLTGTFGNSTRRSTFQWLYRRRSRIDTSIWACESHRDFHAKLFLWKLKTGRAVAWVGSANLTDGGLQKEGELLLEVSDKWDSRQFQLLRAAFEDEWKRGEPLDRAFLRGYKEAKRQPPDGYVRTGRRAHRIPAARGVFTTYAGSWYSEGSPTAQRIDELLGGTATAWHRMGKPNLSGLGVGHQCVYVDVVDNYATVVTVTDVARDKGAVVFAYEPVFARNAWIRWNRKVKTKLAAEGIRMRGRSLGSRWLKKEEARTVYRVLYGRRAARIPALTL